jgi:esterase
MAAIELHNRTLGEGKDLFIFHGLFGYSDNWQTLGRRFSEHFRVHLADLRNHGHSPHAEVFSYDAMADDIRFLLDKERVEKASLLGHSMGGKAVMTFAQKYPDRVDKLIVADMGIKAYPPHHETIIKGLLSLDLDLIKGRTEADKQLSQYISEIGIRQFLLKNLYWIEKGKLAWRMNLPVIHRNMDNVLSALDSKIVDAPTLFVRGEKSGYIIPKDYDEIKKVFPQSEISTIEGAGHWLHAEAPDTFYSIVMNFLLQ